MSKTSRSLIQITLPNNLTRSKLRESLTSWMEAYFQFEVTTLPSSQKEQRRDIQMFISFLVGETGSDNPDNWSPRVSQAFKRKLQTTLKEDGTRNWNDRSVNRIIAHLKTFAKWVHKHRPFVLGQPMEKVKSIKAASLLSIERAISPAERRRLLDAADLLVKVGGISRDRRRHGKDDERPKRKSYRPYRNRAVIYTLIETGMRRAAITHIKLSDVDFEARTIRTTEKGSYSHDYTISKEGLKAIRDYIEGERSQDKAYYDSPALFLPAHSTQNKTGELNPNAVNDIWDHVSQAAHVSKKTPHSARHAMGRYLIEKTGNVAAVQRQLGHKNAAYSLQYSRITGDELKKVLDNRD